MCKLRFWGQNIFLRCFLKYPAFRYYVKVPHKKMKLYNVTCSIILQILRGVHILHQRSFVTFLTMILVFTISIRPKVHGNRQLFEDQSTLKKTPFWKVFLKSVNPFYLAVPHHSQSYCLFVLYIQMLTIFGTASKRKEIILVIFAAGNVKNNDELFLLQLLIHMNSGKSFSMFIRAKKEKKIMKRL